jgi:transposase
MALRQRIIAWYEQGKKTRHIAEMTGYCVAAVRRVRQLFKARGTLEPQTHLCGRKGYFTAARQARLAELLRDHPDATLAELCGMMDREVAVSTMDVWVRKLGVTFKTSPSARRSRTAPTSPPSAPPGTKNSRTSRRKSSSSLTNRASKPT